MEIPIVYAGNSSDLPKHKPKTSEETLYLGQSYMKMLAEIITSKFGKQPPDTERTLYRSLVKEWIKETHKLVVKGENHES